MPLIRALRAWLGGRMAVHDTYYPGGGMEPARSGMDPTGAIWLVLVLIGLPLIALLVIVGLFYEALIRIDRRPVLPSPVHWAISAGFGTVLAAGLTAVVLDRL